MRKLIVSALAMVGMAAAAAPAHAQVPGVGIKINPRIGIYVPTTDLADAASTNSSFSAALDNSMALGLGVELELPMLPVNLRANLDYATSSALTVEDGTLGTVEGPSTTLLAVVGDLVFRPIPKLILVQPYLFAGGGLKKYQVDTNTSFTEFRDESDGTIHVGGGLDVGFGPLALNAELGDYISWYQIQQQSDSKMQHDLFLTVGFAIGLL